MTSSSGHHIALDVEEYFSHFVDKIRLDLEKRRRQDRALVGLNGIYD